MIWNEQQPIFRQLEAHIKNLILEHAIKEGEALPSVRHMAAEFRLNPITVSKAVNELVQETLIEKKRGLGMYVCDGARGQLLAIEREKFIQHEWPRVHQKIIQLGLDIEQLMQKEDK